MGGVDHIRAHDIVMVDLLLFIVFSRKDLGIL